ncbi:hypothetical protein BH24ACT5_BH24ACT5_13810 [soil metagenome]
MVSVAVAVSTVAVTAWASWAGAGSIGASEASPETHSPTTVAGPTSTAVVVAGTPRACSAGQIGGDVGVELAPDVICSAGFALGLLQSRVPVDGSPLTTNPCSAMEGCALADVFHLTTTGWVHDGLHDRECAETIGVVFMSPQTAQTFGPVCDPVTWHGPDYTLDRGIHGVEVMYIQIALVGQGYPIAVDGTYGIETQGAVRAFQQARGLPATGAANAETQALLGTGPNPPPTTTTTAPPPTPAPTPAPTAPPTTAAPVVVPGAARPCSIDVIEGDTGVDLDAGLDVSCRAGWALGWTAGCADVTEGECESVEVFSVSSEGWVYAWFAYAYCAEALAGAGMSVHTAIGIGVPSCESVPARVNISPGSSGNAVRNVQIALLGLGYPLFTDGEYGPRTESAVRHFQSTNGLQVDGIAGPNTQQALGM